MHLPIKKRRVSVRGTAEDADSSMTEPTGTHSGGPGSPPTETNNGAPNLSTAPTGNCYEVFLSSRGSDTGKGFIDRLYTGLVGVGICAFRDDDNELLRQVEEIGPDLLAAIKNSKILIPVLSENYGSSKRCLDELVQMMECKNNDTGHVILPIFYKVEPAHVRHQIGSFGDAFHTHERHSDPTILEKWKQALNEVGSLKGWEANGYEGELVKSIIRKVLSELKKKFELVNPENLVGIDSHVEKVMEFVDNNSRATLFVGIHGIEGIGKTTLAKTIYKKLSNQFEYRSFIADIRESYKHNGLAYLQNQLISDVLKQKNQVDNKDEGIEFISSKFGTKKVLIVLDDVDNDDQLKALAGNRDWFSSGSRIIVTTRNKSILVNAWVDYNYEHEEMDEDKSLILFSRHAFRRDSPPSEFEDLTHDVVSTTRGLPLILEVLGSFLCAKEPTLWRSTINKLRKVPHKKVRDKLKISYEALEYTQKQIFLDIACFFIGTDERIASYMWDACDFFPEEGIEVLRFMSLIKVGDNHELIMHDQLRDLGREIVREENKLEPQYRSRLWDSKEVLKVLKGNKGTEKIKAIYLSKGNSEGSGKTVGQSGDFPTDEQFKNLTSLRFLHMSGAHFRGDFKNSIDELRWLRWWNCPLTFEANNFHAKELLALDLSASKISQEWRGWSSIMMAKKLKYLDLTNCQSLEGTFFLSAFKILEVLILRNCRKLEQIDSSIGEMKSLVRLDLTGCWGLKELPTEVDKLEALEQLLLKNCQNFSVLPDNIGDLQNLEILNISGTRIKELPNGIRRLRKLRHLDVSWCIKPEEEMSECIHNLSFEQFFLSHGREEFPWLSEVQSLPELPSNLTYLSVTCQSLRLPSLSHLTHLKELHLLDCKFLECILELPSTLLELSECSQLVDVEKSKLQKSLNTPFKLEILAICGCKLMETLDVSLFSHLRTLFAQDCNNILEVRGLDKLKYLESLTTIRCDSIERLDLSKSEGVKKLHVENCKNLVDLQGLNRLEFLQELLISQCTSIERLDLPKSMGMKKLYVHSCKNLVEIQGVESLKELYIYHCASIEILDLSKFEGLRTLYAGWCGKLVKVQSLDRLKFLEVLSIFRCASIERLDLLKSESIKKIHVDGCIKLVEIQGLDRLEFLEELDISRCGLIERLDLSKFKGLKKLRAEWCKKLVEIQGLNRLEFLEELRISGHASIEKLDLSRSKGLKILCAQCCKILVEIQGLNRMEFLKVLNISGSSSIKMLDLPKSEGLEILDANNCKNLIEIQGLYRLEFLEKLSIFNCALMERLDLSKSEGLKKLYVGCCEKLVEIQCLNRLEFLKVLIISGCASIERLDLAKTKGLEILDVENCNNLVEIQGLDRLEFLEELNISGCTLIERLNLSKSEGLKTLDAQNCKSLVEIQGLDRLEFLEELNISGCASIKRLDISKSKGLKILDAQSCKNIVGIQGLEKLDFLKELNISGCISIEKLDLSKSEGLKILNAQNCKNLIEIQGLNRLESLEVRNIPWWTSFGRPREIPILHNFL
ncbi:disease resistance protein L6-like [Syzygium oleosum]|uniref:disease resistance protein L6-like n=1 Tax=Syzygium oleosum TaxID=219896 RepID=UPI0011D2526C|nr:disease resistance protein L6-like [Syzygium oleosum]XP_056168924.1 disease resistance protein L6-like [Syzygium oleosum]